ncbi:hypothetical protein HIM_09397 [Hirsutella minnesotensis 3608]|uniref:Uncharacterized protein n=1 Tax=Hirsutella minnesotensis 3608 TaxID=1043627 RepID=A0A0F7ZGN3_9HYPO|nr:hypothetical protein HIM_09397 [Hirsutella minnesotensis 3608]
MSNYYDDEDVDIHVRHRAYSPQPAGPSHLIPEQHTTVVARSRSRERSRSSPRPNPAQPVIINNQFYRDNSSDDDLTCDSHRKHGRVSRRHRRRSSSSYSRSHSRSRSRSSAYKTREEWEAEQVRRELEQLRLAQSRDKEGQRIAKEYRDDAELQRAKRELDEIKKRESRAEEEKRIKKELELKRLMEEEETAQEKKRRDKEAAQAVERYKQQEAERLAREKKMKEESEREYKRRLQEDLAKSGLDEKAITAIVNKQKVPERATNPEPAARPTYTRMSRRHLSIETLRTYHVDFDIDSDPEYILIKRWVPEWEQDQFWKHTRYVREKRGGVLLLEEKKHRQADPEFEWVRKKNDRKRSKSPGLLMYLAGGRPS